MKAAILLSIMLFTSTTLYAEDSKKEYMLSFTNIEVFQQKILPALSVEIKPKSLEKFDFMIAYASKLFPKIIVQNSLYGQNSDSQNIYLTLNYRF